MSYQQSLFFPGKGFVDHPGGVRLGKPQEVLLSTDVVEKDLAPGGSGWYVIVSTRTGAPSQGGLSGCWRGPGGVPGQLHQVGL